MPKVVILAMLMYLQMIESAEDQSKFEAIYKEYKGLMYHVAYARLQHKQDAEDAVHHVFVKIAENIKMIEPVSPKTKQLVVTMVDNRVTDMLRTRSRHPVTTYDDELQNRLSAELEGENLLTESIMELPEQQRMVIWMKYVQGYTLREIAKKLGISLVWAQKIDQRAKKKLEKIYKDRGGML
jgi:RNA polymerase sigma-70 factor (ECF subfamily)